MKRYVIDTNLFFNMGSGLGFGKTTQGVVEKITQIMRSEGVKENIELLVPPRVVDEFLSFFEDKEQLFIKDFLGVLSVKSPDAGSLTVPATIFAEMVKDVRTRSYRGLRIGEEEIVRTAKECVGTSNLSAVELQKKTGEFIKSFRDRYRNATRTGFLDSSADLDLILLAKEQDAFLVTADEGVVQWGRLFGVKEVTPEVFGRSLENESRSR